jgi:hypothetical protein
MNVEQDRQVYNNNYKQPLIQAKAKQLQEEVNLFLNCYEHVSTKNYLLPNSGALLVVRFEEHAMYDYATQRLKRGIWKTASCFRF